MADRKMFQLVLIAVFFVTLFSITSRDVFFTSYNFTSMAYQIPEVTILSIAVMLSMLTGGIDLSIVAISNASALVASHIMVQHLNEAGTTPNSWILAACFIGILIGVSCGLVNSLLIAWLNITPILATLATMTLFNGIAIGITNGKSVSGLPEQFLRLGNGTFFGIPTPFITMLMLATFIGFLINRTGLGLKVFLIGTNRKAAQYSGIADRKVIAWTYALSGCLSAIAGLIIASRTSAASPDFGASYILLAIVIVVLGGVNPAGGFGTVSGVVLATMVLQMLSSGFNALRFNQFYYLVAQGGMLIAVMVLNLVLERRSINGAIQQSRRT
jgi:simple sugar transport system permease protein